MPSHPRQVVTRPRTSRAAAVGGGAVGAGALVMLVAVIALPGGWTSGYISEAGTSGQTFAYPYRAGLVLLAAGVALIGSRLVRVARWLLLPAAVMAATSGLVPCTTGCPLPPYEPTTVSDVAHTLASIVGMVLLALAMIAVAWFPDSGRSQRRLAAAAAAAMIPVGLWLAGIMLLVGRAQIGATLERWMLVFAVSWLIGAAIIDTRRDPRGRAASEQDGGEGAG